MKNPRIKKAFKFQKSSKENFDKIWRSCKENTNRDFFRSVFSYCEFLAIYMQTEMEIMNTGVLTKKIFETSKEKIRNVDVLVDVLEFAEANVVKVLLPCWEYGKDLALIEGISEDEVTCYLQNFEEKLVF